MKEKVRGKRLIRDAVIADSHLNPEEGENTSPWATNHLANQRNKVVVEAVNKIGPEFVVHLGDVVHPLPYSKLYESAAKAANSIFGNLDSKMYITPGNHDVGDKSLPGNPAAMISEKSCQEYEKFFGKEWQAFEHKNVYFVIINSCHFGSNTKREKEQWKWLEQTLDANKNKRIFLFSHYPPYITEENEQNHYDNIDSAPRKKLIDIIKKYKIEAIFAGHVHTFFINQIDKTWSYALPSSTNFRQDYSEILRVNPAEEFGRNDLGKFGFFIVDIHEEGHKCHFIRTNGDTKLANSNEIAKQINTIEGESSQDNFSIDMPHDWCEVTNLPFNPPLDAFIRKKVRNDYSILNLWDCGVRHIRTPITDLADDNFWGRIQLLCNLGIRFTLFTTGPIKDVELNRIILIKDSIAALEYIGLSFDEIHEPPCTGLENIPTYFSPINPPNSLNENTGPFDHVMFSGFDIKEVGRQIALIQKIKADGVVIRISIDLPVLESIKEFYSTMDKFHHLIIFDVCLKANKSSVQNCNDDKNLKRVIESAEASKLFPNSIIRLDTFVDIDRGYFLRNGLFDRRHNPRKASFELRKILRKN